MNSAREMTFDQAVEGLITTMLDDPETVQGRPLVVFEDQLVGAAWTLMPTDPSGSYEKRWREIVDRVDRDWINLRLFPADNDAVGVLVEYFDSGNPSRCHPGVTVVFGGSLTKPS